jgi:hypothetical protein
VTAALGEAQYSYADGEHSVASIGNKERFVWGKRVAVEIDLTDFIAAGLKPHMLMDGAVNGDILTVELTGAAAVESADKFAAFEKNIRAGRSALGFDADMGHFGISFGGKDKNNMSDLTFEWAQYPDKNDKDFVFLLNPMPFTEAGLKPEQLASGGWLYAELEMMNGSAKYKSWMLVRAYDLK